jgi:hypothetical protein
MMMRLMRMMVPIRMIAKTGAATKVIKTTIMTRVHQTKANS